MSITKEDNKTYTVRYRVTDAITGKTTQKKKRGFKTKTEAKEYERSLSRFHSEVLFYTLFKEFINQKDCNTTTIIELEHLLQNHLPALLTVPYEKMTKPYLIELRQSIAAMNLSAQRKNKIIDNIKGTCRYAFEIYDLQDFSAVLKRFKIVKHEMTIWNIDEYIKFENAVREYRPEFVPFFHLLYFTGLRKGEARALLTDDLDINNATISVTKAMRRDISSLGATKNPQSVRRVKLDEFTLSLVSPLKSHEKWLFGDYKPLSNSVIARVFDYCTKAAGLPHIRIHDLRHSHCSYLLGNGVDVVSAARRMGHSSISTTLNTYSHVLSNADEKMANILNVPTLCPEAKEKPDKMGSN